MGTAGNMGEGRGRACTNIVIMIVIIAVTEDLSTMGTVLADNLSTVDVQVQITAWPPTL